MINSTNSTTSISSLFIDANNGILSYCLRGQKDQGWGYQPQSLAFDNIDSWIYLVQLNGSNENNYISRFLSNDVVNQQPHDYMQAPEGFGHQGLAVFNHSGKPIIIAPSETEGSVIFFDYNPESTPETTIASVFDTGAVTVGQNEDCSLLAFRQDELSGNNVIVVDAISFISTPDNPYVKYTVQLISSGYALQALTIVGDELHVISSSANIFDSMVYDIYDLATGSHTFRSSNFTIGAADAYASGQYDFCDGYYEAEGLCVKNSTPHVLISSGDAARKLNRVYQLSPYAYPKEKSVYTALADSFIGNATDEQLIKIKSTITKLYRTGLAKKLSHLFIFNAPTEALAKVNWMDPFNDDHLISNGNGMFFTPNQGFKATEIATDYLKINRGMISELAPLDRGFASFGLICEDNEEDYGYLVTSSGGSGATNFRFNPRDSNGTYNVGIFGTMADSSTIGQYSGFSILSREKDLLKFYNEDKLIFSQNIGFNTPGDYYITLGGGINSCNRNIQMFCIGGTLSDEEVKTLRQIVDYACSIFSASV